MKNTDNKTWNPRQKNFLLSLAALACPVIAFFIMLVFQEYTDSFPDYSHTDDESTHLWAGILGLCMVLQLFFALVAGLLTGLIFCTAALWQTGKLTPVNAIAWVVNGFPLLCLAGWLIVK